MNGSILSLIRAKFNTLSETQKVVAEYVLKNSDTVMRSSINDLADACNVSETTVVRFLRKLGYNSYQVFRVNIAQEISHGKSENIYSEITEEDNVTEVINKVIHSTAQAITDSSEILDPQHLTQIVEKLIAARNVFVIGVGASAALAFDLNHKLLRLGLNSSFCNDSHLINIKCSNMTSEDLLVAFSHSGESREILGGATYVGQNNCPVVAITSYPHSSLASLATYIMLSSSQETRYRSDAMTSRFIQLTVIDMIYLVLAIRMGEHASKNINKSRIAVAKNKT